MVWGPFHSDNGIPYYQFSRQTCILMSYKWKWPTLQKVLEMLCDVTPAFYVLCIFTEFPPLKLFSRNIANMNFVSLTQGVWEIF
jgi:hypothetical protein